MKEPIALYSNIQMTSGFKIKRIKLEKEEYINRLTGDIIVLSENMILHFSADSLSAEAA